jgi:hypothetical protein
MTLLVAEGGTNVSTLGPMARVIGGGTDFAHCRAMGLQEHCNAC